MHIAMNARKIPNATDDGTEMPTLIKVYEIATPNTKNTLIKIVEA